MINQKNKHILICYRYDSERKYPLAGTKGFCSLCGELVYIAFCSMNGIRKDLPHYDFKIVCVECSVDELKNKKDIRFIGPTPV